MQLESIELNNWQSYRGNKHKFEFSGPSSTRNSAIIIGRNGKGKSALFESLRFLLYGRKILVDRDSSTTPKRVKPLVSKNKIDKPLMCWEAWKSGSLSFGVKASVMIKGKLYTIERKYSSTKKEPSEGDLKEEFYILESTKKNKVPKPEEFITSILPLGITKFFTIDGELLIDYRRIFSSERAGMASDLEKILRMGILDSAIFQTNSRKKSLGSLKRKKEREKIDGDDLKKELEDLDDDIDDVANKIEETEDEIKAKGEEYDDLLKWMGTHGNKTAHLDKLDDLKEDTQETNDRIKQLKEKRGSQFTSGWKQVLGQKARDAIETQEEILQRQKANRGEAAQLNGQIVAKKNLVANEPCIYCDQTKPMSGADRVRFSNQIEVLEIALKSLNKQSETPDPYPVIERINSMRAMLTDISYSDTHDLSKQIAEQDIKLISLESDRKATLKELDEESLRMGREKKTQLALVSSELESARDMLQVHLRNEEHLLNRRKIRGGKEKKSTGGDDVVSNLNKQIEIADLLVGLCNDAKEPFRDATRMSVSEIAEKTYLKLIDEDHDSLEFDSQFRVRVYEDNGTSEVILTPGQMGLATYCILEALSIVADIDFPLIVDSPGQGIDMEYMEQIFGHILEQSERQIIVMPNTSETGRGDIIENFGSSVASIYEVQRPRGSKETTIVEVHRRKK